MKLLVLHSHLAGYTFASLSRLVESYGVEVFLVHYAGDTNSPFLIDTRAFSKVDIFSLQKWMHTVDEILDFTPEVVILSGWRNLRYVQLAHRLKQQGVIVICTLDNQWFGSFKQQIARFIGRYPLHSFCDALWGAGERQALYAHRLGFHGIRYWRCMYTCDSATFCQSKQVQPLSQSFVYIGRLVEEKGISDLLDAYKTYRTISAEPWDLTIWGSGPLKDRIAGTGVIAMGFGQPLVLADFLKRTTGVFILPSHFEPWGVVIHEVASVGLPIICSEACGAGVHLVQPYFNGLIFQTKNVRDLLQSMLYMHNLDEQERLRWGENSILLSKSFSTDIWCRTLINGVEKLRA